MRLGVFGGSFDPIHKGHVAAAVSVLAARGLDRLLLVPAARPPHKEGCEAPFEDRLAMARLAAEGHPGLEVSGIEGERAGRSYTFDTLEALERLHPDAVWELLVGADMLADLPRWHRAEELLARVEVVAFRKPGWDPPAPPSIPCHWVEIPGIEVSATEVRRRLAAGLDVAGLLNPCVFAYIRSKGLYRG